MAGASNAASRRSAVGPKGLNKPAQGNALGGGSANILRPAGAKQGARRLFRPYRAGKHFCAGVLGRCPGLACPAPLGPVERAFAGTPAAYAGSAWLDSLRKHGHGRSAALAAMRASPARLKRTALCGLMNTPSRLAVTPR